MVRAVRAEPAVLDGRDNTWRHSQTRCWACVVRTAALYQQLSMRVRPLPEVLSLFECNSVDLACSCGKSDHGRFLLP